MINYYSNKIEDSQQPKDGAEQYIGSISVSILHSSVKTHEQTLQVFFGRLLCILLQGKGFYKYCKSLFGNLYLKQ